MASPDASSDVDGLLPRKFFIPLENNPEALAHLANLLGARNITFHDVLTLTPPFPLPIPRPVHALILNCSSTSFHAARDVELASLPAYEGYGEKEPVVWFKQTINHACGLIALLHGLCNGVVADSGEEEGQGRFKGNERFVVEGGEIERILREGVPLNPIARANLLTASEKIEKSHFEAASMGSTTTPNPMDPVDGHFVCFVKGGDGHLWELSGYVPGPIDRGYLGTAADALSEKALDLGVKSIFEKAGDGDFNISIVALCLDFGDEVAVGF